MARDRDTFSEAPTKRAKLIGELPFRRGLVAALAPLDAFPVENGASPGTPDVNYIDGWIEVKLVDDWPKRAATPVRIKHFTPEQRATLLQRCLRGGRAFLLVYRPDNNEVYIFDGMYAAHAVGNVTELELRKHALYNGQYSDRAMLGFFHSRNHSS